MEKMDNSIPPTSLDLSPESRDVQKATEWFKQWGVYRSIVDNNWMCHGPIHTAIHEFVVAAYPGPFSVLDLGCGDAGLIQDTFQDNPIGTYTGVDASSAALAEARRVFATSNFPARFVEGDLLGYLANQPEGAKHKGPDIVMAGYAVHHLSLSDKKLFFSLAHSRLAQHGTLVFYDVFRRSEESREEYIAAYLSMMKAEWGLTPDGLSGTHRHIEDCDFPEPKEAILAMAHDAGFTNSPLELFADKHGFHRLFAFTK